MAKKREYGQRVREVERGVFTPLVLSTNGRTGKEAATFLQATCRRDCTEETAPILQGHGMAQMPAHVRIHPILNHVHSGKPLIATQTRIHGQYHTCILGARHRRRNRGGTGGTCPHKRLDWGAVPPQKAGMAI